MRRRKYNKHPARNPENHGRSYTVEHDCWSAIYQRCHNPNNDNYHNYGGRGIRVCPRWMKFSNFFADMGPRPSPNHEIDRIDNNGDYKPTNCRWATVKQQGNNRRTNHLITFGGQTHTMMQWAELLHVPYTNFKARVHAGWPLKKVFDQPYENHSKLYYHKGEHKTSSEWAKLYNVSHATLNWRLRHGWDINRALTQKPRICRWTIQD